MGTSSRVLVLELLVTDLSRLHCCKWMQITHHTPMVDYLALQSSERWWRQALLVIAPSQPYEPDVNDFLPTAQHGADSIDHLTCFADPLHFFRGSRHLTNSTWDSVIGPKSLRTNHRASSSLAMSEKCMCKLMWPSTCVPCEYSHRRFQGIRAQPALMRFASYVTPDLNIRVTEVG